MYIFRADFIILYSMYFLWKFILKTAFKISSEEVYIS